MLLATYSQHFQIDEVSFCAVAPVFVINRQSAAIIYNTMISATKSEPLLLFERSIEGGNSSRIEVLSQESLPVSSSSPGAHPD